MVYMIETDEYDSNKSPDIAIHKKHSFLLSEPQFKSFLRQARMPSGRDYGMIRFRSALRKTECSVTRILENTKVIFDRSKYVPDMMKNLIKIAKSA